MLKNQKTHSIKLITKSIYTSSSLTISNALNKWLVVRRLSPPSYMPWPAQKKDC